MKEQFFSSLAVYGVLLQGLLFLFFLLQKIHAPLLFEGGLYLFHFGMTMVISVAMSKFLKRIIKKRRPPHSLRKFVPYDTYAFPSSHATGLSTATVIFFMYSFSYGILSSFISFLIMYSRVRTNVHDLGDMIGGVILGLTVSFFIAPYTLALSTIITISFL